MAWILAPSLVALRRETDALWPARSKISDGTIGNAAHAARDSDHNPDARGVVRAWDVTSWAGPDGDVADLVVQHLRATRDPRVSYIIWRRQICNSRAVEGAAPWVWRPYDGVNPHDKHAHISVRSAPTGDDGSPWGLEESIMPTPEEIATAVLNAPIVRAWDGATTSLRSILASTHYYASSAASGGKIPAGASTRPGGATAGASTAAALAAILAGVEAIPAPAAPVDVDALATALAARLPTLAPDAVKQAIREVLGSLDGASPPSAGH